ncbi:hypothetical protein K5X82_05785 [Halosquirtibacter xylanolyticus]|uniref:hypothetical protein n=1 Tax=Halosquirtibacter xylanolyticus TaxID=3374599 RepID=UPI0037496715|nr:hypothetical protein K5X82_05785 [Prolixibacteraceae bacterium]
MGASYAAVVFNWHLNIDYKEYNIHLKSSSSKYIIPWFKVIFISAITLGIGFPMMIVWIARKYIEDLEARKEEGVIGFMAEFDTNDDGMFILKQLLLSVFSLCIYLPFATKNIMNRMIPKIAYINE